MIMNTIMIVDFVWIYLLYQFINIMIHNKGVQNCRVLSMNLSADYFNRISRIPADR